MTDDRWLTFDCFGTLIDWTGGFTAILAPVAGDRTQALLAAYHWIEPALEAERPHRLYRDVLADGLMRAARETGVPLAGSDADILVRRWGDLPLYPDVPEGLAAVRGAGWKVGILTNCDDDLFARTSARHAALSPDLVVTAERTGSYKPSFGHFDYFERRTGVARRDWVHVANSWFHDIEPARRYDVSRVWLDRDRTGEDPDAATWVIASTVDLPAVLARIGPSSGGTECKAHG